MERGAWPDGVELRHNQCVRTPPGPPILRLRSGQALGGKLAPAPWPPTVGGSWRPRSRGAGGGRCLTRSQAEVIIRVIHRKTEQRQAPAMKDQLHPKIHDHTAVVAVVGLAFAEIRMLRERCLA